MRNVNRYFRSVVDENQEVILRASLHDVECIGPHKLLLQLQTPTYNLVSARTIHKQKRMISQVAEMCTIPQSAKIEALYCISHICSQSGAFYPAFLLSPTDAVIERIRTDLLSPFTTIQLQNILSICVRLIFKIAELMGVHVQGSPLHVDKYSMYNEVLVANGPEIIYELANRDLSQREEYLRTEIVRVGEVPWMHEELICFLKTRGLGLLTDPAIEIQQFFQEEGTTLDLRRYDED